ncbi:TetR/AcrR family transcriptional regulator [Actinoplanes sp. NPDC049265]|uniref:TetR/AcrR family transcriptional regulator n=1 Tax=Actinoplanes sp. NPDC049265 TaxID=3363902 RepID=UPI0037164C47
MPTGVAIRDVREHLFGAAERVLRRAGVNALTSRAVTTEAGVAKGVLHRHFADFDAFLAELVLDRIAGLATRRAALLEQAGQGTVEGNLAAALRDIFGSVAGAMLSLIIARDELRSRLRAAGLTGIPMAADAMQMIIAYLTEEQRAGRIAADADVASMALMLVGSGHLIAASEEDDFDRVVAAALRAAG